MAEFLKLPQEYLKAENERIVKGNLLLMETDMRKLLKGESFGGNAGSVTIDGVDYPCGAANGLANKETGEIVVFGNIQNIKGNLSDDPVNVIITLRVAMDVVTTEKLQANKLKGFFRIVDVFGSELSELARQRISETADAYNAAHENKPDQTL